MFKQLVTTSLFLILSGCISVKIPLGAAGKDEKVQFQNPIAPFSEVTSEVGDKLWLSGKTGNSISFKSECGIKTSTPEKVGKEALAALKSLQIIEQNKSTHQGKESWQAIAKGKVDSASVKIQILSIVHKDCSYLISYGGIEKNYEVEEAAYVEFKNHFVIP